MRINKIQLKNFMPFVDDEIVFPIGKDIIGIEGEWAGNPKRSNRAGKSALLEALTYALYGDTRADKEKELRNSSAPKEEFWVELELSFPDGTEATIKRGRTKDDDPILEFDDGDSVSGSTANFEIEKMVGFSLEEFEATHFFKQGDIHQFMSATNKKKRELLLGWLPFLTVYNDGKEVVRDELKEVRVELKTAETFLTEEYDEEAYGNGIKELADVRKEVKGKVVGIQDLEKKEEKANKKLSSLVRTEELTRKVEEYKEENGEAEERFKKAEKELKTHEEGYKKFKKTYNITGPKKILENIQTQLDSGLERTTTLKGKLKELEIQEEQLNDNKGICPILKEGCDRIEGDRSKLETDIKKTENEMKQVYKARSKLKEQRNDLTETIEELEGKDRAGKSNIENLTTKKNEAAHALTRWETKLGEAKEELKARGTFDQDKVDEVNEQLENIRDRLSELREEKSEANQRQGRLEAELETMQEVQQSRLKWEGKVEGLERRKRVLSFLDYAFGENGIMGSQVESVFADIQDDTNYVLAALGLGLSITISPFRELESYDEECPACGTYLGKSKKARCPSCETDRPKKKKDELTLNVTDNSQGGKTESWKMDSGAGKTLITLSVRLAISRMIQRMRARSCGILVLDEVFAMLDPVNRDGLLELLETIKTKLGFEQIFVVSHTEVKDFIPDVLVVKRNNENVAELKWR